MPQAKGEKIATYGLTEPNAGSDAVGIQTTAVRKGDRYVLNGEKVWISLADVADHFLVIAWTDQEKKKNRDHSGPQRLHRGARLQGLQLLHDQGEVGDPGRQHRRLLHGTTSRCPVENRVGEEGEGFKVAMFALENGRYTVAAGATGLIRACLDASVKYARERKTFGAAHRRAPAGEGDDRGDGLRLRRRAPALAARGLAQERGPAQHPRDVAGQVVRHRARASARPPTACRSTAATATPTSTRSGRFYRNSKAAVIYEGTREIHKIMQADYALGYRQDKPRRVELPALQAS